MTEDDEEEGANRLTVYDHPDLGGNVDKVEILDVGRDASLVWTRHDTYNLSETRQSVSPDYAAHAKELAEIEAKTKVEIAKIEADGRTQVAKQTHAEPMRIAMRPVWGVVVVLGGGGALALVMAQPWVAAVCFAGLGVVIGPTREQVAGA